MEGWNDSKLILPPLDTLVEVKARINYYETYFETPLIRAHVILKWGITHWKLSNNQDGTKQHKNISQQYQQSPD